MDEADFVKTDGHRVFYLSGSRLSVLKSWPADQTALQSQTEIEGWPSEMLLHGNRLVVFSLVPSAVFDPARNAEPAVDYYWGYPYGDGTKVSVFDVTTDTPVLLSAWYLAGTYSTSRRMDGVVRIVLSGHLRWPKLSYWPEGRWDSGTPEFQEALSVLMEENARKIRAQTLSQWLTGSYYADGNQSLEVIRDCTRYYRPTVTTDLGLAVVATLDLDSSVGLLDMAAVVARVGQTYASRENLYIATVDWWPSGSQDGSGERTSVHKLSLANPSRVEYRASGSVPGHILDQFSMDEHHGYLRLAITRGGSWDGQVESENRVVVLAEELGRLRIVGQTPPLAPGEHIYSSRFSGDRGFVVTYRQVDPLFAIDLRDPTAPQVVSELKIPGFSTYIHMLDEGHLLTIGHDTVAEPGGRETRKGLALQIFDVTDMANPRLTAKQLIGTQYGYSQALWEHKAFNYFPKTGMLAIPFADWVPLGTDYWGSFVSTLKVFRIDAQGGITPQGEVSHADLYQAHAYNQWSWWYQPYIRRSVQIEDFVYSFSSAGVKVNRTADLSETLQTVRLPLEPAS